MTKLLQKQQDTQQKIKNILADNNRFEDSFVSAKNVYADKFKNPRDSESLDEKLQSDTPDQIRNCLKFLLVCELTNSNVLREHFYPLKHAVERWGKCNNNYIYISEIAMKLACIMCDWPLVCEKRETSRGDFVPYYCVKIVTPEIQKKRIDVENMNTFWQSPLISDEACKVFEFTTDEEIQIEDLVQERIDQGKEITDKLREKAEREVWNKKDIPTFDEWFAEYRDWWLHDVCYDYNYERVSVGLQKVSIKNVGKRIWDRLVEKSKFGARIKTGFSNAFSDAFYKFDGWIYAYTVYSEVKNSPSEYPIKVGYTKKSPPTARIQSATRSFPRPPKVIGIWEAPHGYKTESMFHKLLEENGCSRENLQGREWFMCRKDVFDRVVNEMGLRKVQA